MQTPMFSFLVSLASHRTPVRANFILRRFATDLDAKKLFKQTRVSRVSKVNPKNFIGSIMNLSL